MGTSRPRSPPAMTDAMTAASGRPCCRRGVSTTQPSSLGRRRGVRRHHQPQHVTVQRTDVVVIGNGPSAICLSYMLSGHWPYYNGAVHPDELLTARLSTVDTSQSLLFQDLPFLSDGLEGRTSNPVALLFDTLSNPDADFGAQLPSLIHWEFHPDREIPHVVLGRHAEGGVWQTVEDHVQTLSLGEWMQLPEFPFADWRDSHRKDQSGCMDIGASAGSSHRATAAEIRQYYRDYVAEHRLGSHFVSHVVVTSVERVNNSSAVRTDCENGEEDLGISNNCGHGSQQTVWEVRGYHLTDDGNTSDAIREEFCYQAPAVVLATGVFDVPNVLQVHGETQPFVLHSAAELVERIKSGEIGSHSDPVVIIGAGLSAADAILQARAEHIPVVHVFRSGAHDNLSVYQQLPPTLYPEYHVVRRLMKSEHSIQDDDLYTSYPNAAVVEFTSSNEVVLHCDYIKGEVVIRASCAIVLIGSHPNLSFLRGDDLHIGVVPGVAVDGKHNPIDIDPYTYQSQRQRGLYAVGPLIGDNFVRFLRGGAFGVTSHLWQQRETQKSSLSQS